MRITPAGLRESHPHHIQMYERSTKLSFVKFYIYNPDPVCGVRRTFRSNELIKTFQGLPQSGDPSNFALMNAGEHKAFGEYPKTKGRISLEPSGKIPVVPYGMF